MKRNFWNWIKNENGRTLYLEGPIAEESWYGDEVTPKQFKSELMSETGDITIWVNSPGGDVFSAAQIYNMLMDYPGKVTIKIDGIAASAASVIAMAGSEVLMSPVSCLMIHNPLALAFGDTVEMEKTIAMLNEVKESIINAYEIKSGLSRAKIARLMDAETWMNARKAVELGFADGILFADVQDAPESEGIIFSNLAVTNSLMRKLPQRPKPPDSEQENNIQIQSTPVESLEKRLFLISALRRVHANERERNKPHAKRVGTEVYR